VQASNPIGLSIFFGTLQTAGLTMPNGVQFQGTLTGIVRRWCEGQAESCSTARSEFRCNPAAVLLCTSASSSRFSASC